MKNYYDILEISSTSTLEEIKKAYRTLAIKYHPDKNLGDQFFTDKFIEIKEAYDILSNPSLKTEYDKEYTGVSQKQTKEEQTKYYTEQKQQKQHQKEKEEKFFYEPFKAFYSNRDRDLQDTPQYNPIYDFWGGNIHKDLDFFKLPKNIGKLICGYSDLFISDQPLSNITKIKRNVIGFIIGTIIGVIIVLFSHVSNPVEIIIFFVAPISVSMWFASRGHYFSGYNAFVGVNGFAEFSCEKDRRNVNKNTEVNFNDITDLYVYYLELRVNYSYSGTKVLFVWLNTVTGKISHTKEGSFNKNEKEVKKQPIDLIFGQLSEKYWTIYLMDKMESILQKEGYLLFNLYFHEKNIFSPYIKLGVGYITFLKSANEVFTYKFNEIKRMYSKGSELHIQHMNFERKYFFLKSGNEDVIPMIKFVQQAIFL